MEEFLHLYEMESLSLGITARKDVIDQVKRFYLGEDADSNGLFRTALAIAARRDHAADTKESKDDDESHIDDDHKAHEAKTFKLVIAGNSKHAFRNRLRNIQLVALSHAIVKSRLSVIHALDLCHNYLGEVHDDSDDAKHTSDGGEVVLDESPYLLDAAPSLARLLQTTALYTSVIQEVDLSYNRIGPESCKLLCAALIDTPSSLRRLNLNGNPLRVTGGHAIAGLLGSHNCKLEELDIGNTELEIENLIAISSVLRDNKTLHTLNLDKPMIRTKEEEAIQHIGKMLQVNDTLRVLSLNKHQLTDHGAQVLAERLLDNSTLQCLTLRANNIGATGAAALAGLLLRHDSLAEFDLSANRIGDLGAEAFAKLLRHNNRPISTLALCSTYLTDDGLSEIAQACLQPRHPETNHLRSLLLWGNDWGSQSAELFLELHRGRFNEWDVETDFEPLPSDSGEGVQIARRDVHRATAFASPKR